MHLVFLHLEYLSPAQLRYPLAQDLASPPSPPRRLCTWCSCIGCMLSFQSDWRACYTVSNSLVLSKYKCFPCCPATDGVAPGKLSSTVPLRITQTIRFCAFENSMLLLKYNSHLASSSPYNLFNLDNLTTHQVKNAV